MLGLKKTTYKNSKLMLIKIETLGAKKNFFFYLTSVS